MVGSVVDGVDTDGVYTELLEPGDITGAAGNICDGVDELGGSTGLVVDTTHVESSIALEESWRELECVNRVSRVL